MKLRPSGALYAYAITFASMSAEAAPVTINITATIGGGDVVEGTFGTSIADGEILSGAFVFDTDEGNAEETSQTTPSTEPGHEFTSFYDFASPPYDVSISGSTGFSFDNEAPVGVVVNDNLEITTEDGLGGFIEPGTYDWIEILGSTASDIAGPNTPGNGQEWTLAIFAGDGTAGVSSWFSDGSLIPDSLPASYTALLVGIDLDENGEEAGVVIAAVDSLTISSVPVPAAAWLFGSGLLGLIGISRRKKSA